MAEYEFESQLKSQSIHVFKVTGKASSRQILLSNSVKFKTDAKRKAPLLKNEWMKPPKKANNGALLRIAKSDASSPVMKSNFKLLLQS